MTIVAARRYAEDQPFFTRLAIGISVLIVIGFAQFAGRGLANYQNLPLWVPLHGLVMLAWLGLFIAQNRLATTNLRLHRKLGKSAAIVVAAIVVTTWYSAIMAVQLNRVPTFFTPAFFLSLSVLESSAFAALVMWGVARRRDPEFHRRLMFGATIVASEPAFGRLLPMPFMIGWGEWVIMACQLGILGLVVRHDRQRLGQVHPATFAAGLTIVAVHLAIEWAGSSAPMLALVARLGG